MRNTSNEDFYAAVGAAVVLYSICRGEPFIAQHGPILGTADHLCVGWVAKQFCKVADIIVGHTCASFGQRPATLLAAVSAVAVGFLGGYPAGNYAAHAINPYVDKYITPYFHEYVVRPIKQELRRDASHKPMSYNAPRYKVSELV